MIFVRYAGITIAFLAPDLLHQKNKPLGIDPPFGLLRPKPLTIRSVEHRMITKIITQMNQKL
jgi:hypothetical protein